jgi:hypothetical protein
MNKKGQPKKSEYDKKKQVWQGFKQGHIRDLGKGDFQKGEIVLKQLCKEHIENQVKLLCKEYIEKKAKG